MAISNSSLFDTVPDKDYGHFFKASGEIEPEKVVKFLKYKKEDVSLASDIPLPSVRYDSRMPQDLEIRMIEWATAINLVASYFKNIEKTMIWFHVPNHLLGDMSPRDMIRVGRFKKLQRFIQTALSENQKISG